MDNYNPQPSEGKELKMIPYNTGEPILRLPEYGRNIQRMAEYLLTVEDRDERTRCAYAIIDTMMTLFPQQKGEESDVKKYWDHLNILTDFRLDVDAPVELLDREEITTRPHAIPLEQSAPRFRHYGKRIQDMITVATQMPEGEEREKLVFMIANQMKKLLVLHNRESATSQHVANDLETLSGGKIRIDPDTFLIYDFKEDTPRNQKNQKKKKK